MIELNTQLEFKYFDVSDNTFKFSTGINFIYGESGVGKSAILDAFQGKKILFPDQQRLTHYPVGLLAKSFQSSKEHGQRYNRV